MKDSSSSKVSAYTPEPWRTDSSIGLSGDLDAHKYDADGKSLIVDGDNHLIADVSFDFAPGECEANARRIVACVNACEGMIDPQTEIAALKDRISMLDYALVENSRDELAEALREVDCDCTLRERDSGHKIDCWMPSVNAALAKLDTDSTK